LRVEAKDQGVKVMSEESRVWSQGFRVKGLKCRFEGQGFRVQV